MRLFRAIRVPEVEDFLVWGRLRNPPGLEVKYFFADRAESERYARMAEATYGDGPYSLVEAEINSSLVNKDMIVEVDRGLHAVVLPSDLLPHVRQAVLIGRIGDL